MRTRILPFLLVLLFLAGASSASEPCTATPAGDGAWKLQPVTGTGVHFFSTAIVHSAIPTATATIQRSTETVELSGDLTGRILYHPTSVFDFVKGTLVNTGNQVFSGTVLGSEPVLLYDDSFRFEVDLVTGATVGVVHLTDTLAGPRIRCHLDVTGTGVGADGNPTFAYTGTCRIKNKDADSN
ncbi:MAG: hypothetical protein ACRD2J_10825 [Thermoanaerobaculia bacterium]